MKSLIICYSNHHNNTQKIAEEMAKVLDAQIKTPQQTTPEELQGYDVVGFGSGIYGGKVHKDMRKLVDNVPQVTSKKAFIFSTCANTRKGTQYHLSLREALQSKGYMIVGEFNCAGFNSWGPFKIIGGTQKGRPNTDDLKRAEDFASNLKK